MKKSTVETMVPDFQAGSGCQNLLFSIFSIKYPCQRVFKVLRSIPKYGKHKCCKEGSTEDCQTRMMKLREGGISITSGRMWHGIADTIFRKKEPAALA